MESLSVSKNVWGISYFFVCTCIAISICIHLVKGGFKGRQERKVLNSIRNTLVPVLYHLKIMRRP